MGVRANRFVRGAQVCGVLEIKKCPPVPVSLERIARRSTVAVSIGQWFVEGSVLIPWLLAVIAPVGE